MSYKLWIDDIRNPPSNDWEIARNSADAKFFVISKGIPDIISFDHDLGADDDSVQFIDWLINTYYDEPVPNYKVHSANPVGILNIISKMESWKKSKEL